MTILLQHFLGGKIQSGYWLGYQLADSSLCQNNSLGLGHRSGSTDWHIQFHIYRKHYHKACVFSFFWVWHKKSINTDSMMKNEHSRWKIHQTNHYRFLQNSPIYRRVESCVGAREMSCASWHARLLERMLLVDSEDLAWYGNYLVNMCICVHVLS